MNDREPSQSLELPPDIIYDYDTHHNIPWNIIQYQPVREYLDPADIVQQRKYQTQKKGEKSNRYQTRRGFYMDYHLKVVKALPAPCIYNLPDGFDQTQFKRQSKLHKLDKSLKKYSYLDAIQIEQKSRKKPGVGAYNVTQTLQQTKKRIKTQRSKKKKIGPKRYFYEDTQHISNNVPGSGYYNPHEDVPNLHLNKTNHKQMIQKHNKQYKTFRKKRLSEPDPGTYRAIPVDPLTFDQIRIKDQIAKKKKKYSVHGFGSNPRFSYQKPVKKKIIQARPEPTTYNTFIQWKGKGGDTKKNGWSRSLSTGFAKSIYH